MAEVRVPQAVRWASAGAALEIIDQTRLPENTTYLRLGSAVETAAAIREMRVRGAPAIGIAAAMGLAVEMGRLARSGVPLGAEAFQEAHALLRSTRPTGHNLSWALERMRCAYARCAGAAAAEVVAALRAEADAIAAEDRLACRRIGELGFELLPPEGATVYTHCNAGALATGGIGTAVAPIYVARERGVPVRVIVGETRPLLQGSRLTAWELSQAGVDVTVVADSVAASLMKEGRVNLVITGADRIAANGDVANKIGTYGLAVLAGHHGIPFYVAAPVSTIDPATRNGGRIPVEQRDAAEVRQGCGAVTAPREVAIANPAFDVTPAGFITAIVTERGVLRPPYSAGIAEVAGQGEGSRPLESG
ncbi:MAG: S-methyl-5-thioribose-1-phosphate isomerase [Gemmatimonadetes bacterium]|nr:S-methyl-5-thioribose-1-phosphate isomerase [Gemmatimonadota bacterium]